MKYKILRICIFCFLLMLLTSCQADTNQPQNTIQSTPQTNYQLSIDSNFFSVSIAEFNKSYVITLDDENSLQLVKNVFAGAIKRDGIANMATPEYVLHVVYEDDKTELLFLWLGDKGQRSTLMKQSDTHTTYAISGILTDSLRNLITKQARLNVFDAREVNVGDAINNLKINSIDITSSINNEYYATVKFEGELQLSGELNIYDKDSTFTEGWGLGNYFQPDEHSLSKVPVLNYEPSRTGFTIIDNTSNQLEQLTPGTYRVNIKVNNYEIWSIGKEQENKATLLEIIDSETIDLD